MRRWWLAFVSASVICAQALGFLHGIAHAVHIGDQRTERTVIAAPQGSYDGWIAALFAYHEDAQDCRMFEGFGQQGPNPSPADLAPALMPGMGFHLLPAGAIVARRTAPFDARGPPLSH